MSRGIRTELGFFAIVLSVGAAGFDAGRATGYYSMNGYPEH